MIEEDGLTIWYEQAGYRGNGLSGVEGDIEGLTLGKWGYGDVGLSFLRCGDARIVVRR